MSARYEFSRLELAGSLGDLGTLLPLALGMILVNGLSPLSIFFTIGVFYILSGAYFGVTVPVQPMKVIGAYAVATGISAAQISASGLLLGIFLFLIGTSGAISLVGRYTPKATIRGVQLATGALLMSQGVKMILGSSKFQILQQAAEPYLSLQSIGPVPIGILTGLTGGLLTLFFLDNKRLPAGLLVIFCGIFMGLLLGTRQGFAGLKLGLYLPSWLPVGIPSRADFTFALFALVLPQIPMTIGNAVIANADLSRQYFGEKSKKVTYRSLTISMALANLMCFVWGGMPLCHGAGGLAAHYRFGARTAGSNLIIGLVFIALALLLGNHALATVYLLPMSILGVLLLFAGSQLAMTITDINDRKELFVVLIMLGITLAANLAVGFVAGFAAAYLLKSKKLNV